jgi:hypothetical protein
MSNSYPPAAKTPACWWPSAKTIPRGMEIANKFGLEFPPPPGV